MRWNKIRTQVVYRFFTGVANSCYSLRFPCADFENNSYIWFCLLGCCFYSMQVGVHSKQSTLNLFQDLSIMGCEPPAIWEWVQTLSYDVPQSAAVHLILSGGFFYFFRHWMINGIAEINCTVQETRVLGVQNCKCVPSASCSVRNCWSTTAVQTLIRQHSQKVASNTLLTKLRLFFFFFF